MDMPLITVIIPFFQREAGILSRALKSIVAQNYPLEKLSVIIIDDGSPFSANEELAQFPPHPELCIDIIQQNNAGPNEARNTGLENIKPSTDLVAYLDSDDEWISEHLHHAVYALSYGFTAYFSNLYHLGDTMPEFQKAQRINFLDHPLVDTNLTIREYRGDMMHQIATANTIFMPSLVIDAKVLGSVRFPQGHKHGGGDYLYWMSLVQHGAKWVFSIEPEVRCGHGINMWYGSGWGTDGLARRICDEARFRKTALSRYAKNLETQTVLKQRIIELQIVFLQDVVHRIRHRKSVDWQLFRQFFLENPLKLITILSFLKTLIEKLMEKIKDTLFGGMGKK